MSRYSGELTPESACYVRARHMPPTIWVNVLGEKRAGVDWQDWGARKDGEPKRHHPLFPRGGERACRMCGRSSWLADCGGKPCHKVCAEDEFLASRA